MAKNIVLLDGGMFKYASRYTAAKHLGISYDAPSSVLATHPRALEMIYNALAASLRSKLGGVETNYGNIDRCIVCLDIGDSWRTQVQKTIIPGTEQASSIAYKGHRRTDDPAELAALFQLNRMYDTALDMICRNANIETVGKHSIEADDFMVVLSKTYADQGDIVFIMSKDADITQAVYTSDKGGTVFVMQPVNDGSMRLVVNHATANSVQQVDIFNMPKWTPALAQAIAGAKIVAPQYILFEKIVNGDASDDISPVMVRAAGDKHYKTRGKALQAVYEHFCQQNSEGYFKLDNMYNDTDIKTILDILHTDMFKTSYNDLPEDWQKFYFDKFIENRKMVCVNLQELGKQRYSDILHAAVEQLHGLVPTIAFPTWQVLQQLTTV